MINRKFDTAKYCYQNVDSVYKNAIVTGNLEYTGRVFTYYSPKGKRNDGTVNYKITRRPIVRKAGFDYVLFNTRHSVDLVSYTGLMAYFNQIILPEPDKSYYLDEVGLKFYYGTGNDKIRKAGKLQGKRNPITFGLPSIMSCFDAGKCKEYCYAEVVNGTYLSTLKLALHNYYLIMTSPVELITALFDGMLKASGTELARIDDTGDIVNLAEFTGLVNAVKSNPEVTVYTYTKSTEIVWRYLEQNGSLPDNLKVNISSTDNEHSQTYATKLVQKYNLPTCFILETADDILAWWDAGLPFNDVEKMAILNTQDFAIALHGTFKKGTPEFDADNMRVKIETEHNAQLC